MFHREAERHAYFGVFGAAGDVDGVFRGQRIAEDCQSAFGVGGSATHLLGILELADRDVPQPEPDDADHLRGESSHQNFDGCRHRLVDVRLQAEWGSSPAIKRGRDKGCSYY